MFPKKDPSSATWQIRDDKMKEKLYSNIRCLNSQTRLTPPLAGFLPDGHRAPTLKLRRQRAAIAFGDGSQAGLRLTNFKRQNLSLSNN